MRPNHTLLPRLALLACALALPGLGWSAETVTLKDGRKVMLKDDGTWDYLDEAAKVEKPTARLVLLRKNDHPYGCRYGVKLFNELPYKINNLVLRFVAVREGGVHYISESKSFYALRPTDSQYHEVALRGIRCGDIKTLLVQGERGCRAGELTMHSARAPDCLALIRLDKTDKVRWVPYLSEEDKAPPPAAPVPTVEQLLQGSGKKKKKKR